MTTVAVLIELPAELANSKEAATLRDACTEGLRSGTCELSGASDAVHPTAVAIVTVERTGGPTVRIEVGRKTGDETAWVSRTLTFRSADDENERWKTVGFAVASLAAPSRAQVAAHPKDRPRTAAPRTKTGEGQPVVTVLFRAEAARGLDAGPIRAGGGIAGTLRPGRTPLMAGLVASYAVGPNAVSNVDLRWVTVGLGAGVHVPLPAELEGRAFLAAVAQNIQASGTEPGTGDRESPSRWLAGGLLEASVRWPRSGPFGAVLGAQLLELSGGTAIRLRGQHRASSPAAVPGGFAGVDFAW